MKNQSIRRDRGFTLVELLVVIAIIAVLASVGFAAGNAAIQKAKKTTTLATASALESAVNGFYTEYGGLPTDATTDDSSKVDTALDGKELLTVLLGMTESATPPKNSRAVKFLNVKQAKANTKKDGLVYNSGATAVVALYDSWGGGVKVIMDADYDERFNNLTISGKSYSLIGRRVAAWSLGADGVKGSGKSGDDVITW